MDLETDFKTNASQSSLGGALGVTPPPTSEGSGPATEAMLGDGTGSSSSSEDVPQGTGANTAPSNTLESDFAGHVNASGLAGAPNASRPAEQHPNHNQMIRPYVYRPPPSDQVLSSKDILPLILGNLKESYAESENWRRAFTSIIRVNRTFFWAGMSILWHTMTSIGPALKLLPWCGASGYQGLGTYRYMSGQDWSRFTLYASFIRKVELKLQPDSDDYLAPHWITELVYLPSRPVLFPYVNTITIGPEVPASLPLLPLLVTTSLQSLEIISCDDEDWLDGADSETQGHFPLIRCFAPFIQSFRYKGAPGQGFFHRLSLLQSITTLFLECLDSVPAGDILCVAELPLLRTLHFATSAPVTPLAQPSPGSPPRIGLALRELKIAGVDMLQVIFAELQCVKPRLENLHLEVTRVDHPTMLQQALGLYLGAHLESVQMQVLPPSEQQDPWPSAARIWLRGLSDLNIEVKARHSFASACNLKKATFKGVPSSLWCFMSSVLRDSIGRWTQLTSLTFQIQRDAANATGSEPSSSMAFPGLSFLATTIWLECPMLEFLEFHFDQLKVTNDDLSQTVQNVRNIAPPVLHHNGHPLQDLIVNTGTVTNNGSGPTFNPDRKIEIVAFLEELFPRLTSDALRGTPAALWSDMGTWLHTYRRMKAKATTGH